MTSATGSRSLPRVLEIGDGVTVFDPAANTQRLLHRHERVGRWTLMAQLERDGDGSIAVFEDIPEQNGRIVFISTDDRPVLELPKSLAPTRVAEASCYAGHTKEEVGYRHDATSFYGALRRRRSG